MRSKNEIVRYEVVRMYLEPRFERGRKDCKVDSSNLQY